MSGPLRMRGGLTVNTVFGHLNSFIEKGELALDRVVPPEKQAAIEKALVPGRPLKEVKMKLGEDFSYGEIQSVIAFRNFRKSSKDSD